MFRIVGAEDELRAWDTSAIVIVALCSKLLRYNFFNLYFLGFLGDLKSDYSSDIQS